MVVIRAELSHRYEQAGSVKNREPGEKKKAATRVASHRGPSG